MSRLNKYVLVPKKADYSSKTMYLSLSLSLYVYMCIIYINILLRSLGLNLGQNIEILMFYKTYGCKTEVFGFFRWFWRFREVREAGRNHFHLSWYLSDAMMTS